MFSLPFFARPRKPSPASVAPVEDATERAIAEFVAGCSDADLWNVDAIADAIALARLRNVQYVGQVARLYHNIIFSDYSD